MPVPWISPNLDMPMLGTDVENRGSTVQQLRDIRTLLQRLCKSRLLKRADQPAVGNAEPVLWIDINMFGKSTSRSA